MKSELAELQSHYQHLTPSEREVLPFVVAGFGNKVTAADLGTSQITIGFTGARSGERWLLNRWLSLANPLGIPLLAGGSA
jgi:FixJ family two-component response regulator